jgi:hypothetical protein
MVRAQVEAIQNQYVQPNYDSNTSRLKAASDTLRRIEEAIDKDYRQSKQMDSVWLDNFDGIVSSLIGLTDQGPIISVPSIRLTLSAMSESEADAIAESCAQVASVWKESQYEISPFKMLTPFHPNQGSISDFSRDWQRFVDAEENRDQVLLDTRGCTITISSPAEEEQWIQTYGNTIAQTDNQTKADYLKWCIKRQPIPLATSIEKLRNIASSLSELDATKWNSTLCPLLATMKPNEISRLRERADLVMNAPEWRKFIDVRCILALVNVQRFLSGTNDASVHGRFDLLVNTIDFFSRFESLYQQWVVLAEELHYPTGSPSDGFDVVKRIKDLLSRLVSVKNIQEALGKTATACNWEKSLEVTDSDGPGSVLKEMEAAVGRAFAREASISALSAIHSISPDARLRLTDVITKDQSTNEIRSKVYDHLKNLRSFMEFSFQKETLSEDASVIRVTVIRCGLGCYRYSRKP